MHITMFMPGLAPDALGWRVHQDFAAAVAVQGHRFEMVTTGPAPARSAPGQPEILTTGPLARIASRLARPVLRTRSLLPAATALAGHLRRHGHAIDLLHVEMAYPHAAAATLAVKLSGWTGPLVVTPMGEDVLVLEDARYGFCRYRVPRALVQWTLRRAAGIRCISPLAEARARELAPATPLRLIPLSVSQRTAEVANEDDSARSARRVASRQAVDAVFDGTREPTILALGRLHPFKGIETLVTALPKIKHARLLIAGPSLSVAPYGDTATRLLDLAVAHGVRERVRWVGPIASDRALDMLAGADVVAVPSHLESLNKVCVEAAAVGTPFVVTRTTGIASWVPAQGVGLVVAPRDPAALAAALDAVLEGRWYGDPGCQTTFVRQFAPTTVATQVVELYETVIDDKPV